MNTETTNMEINKAIRDVEVAQNGLDFAEQEFVDVAILNLTVAMERLNALIKLTKRKALTKQT